MTVFWGTNPSVNEALNKLNMQGSWFRGLINGILNGMGSIAKSAAVELAVQWAIDKATNYEITYSQSNRNLKNPDGTSFDCSSFIITAFYAVGWDINATYTGDMRAGFEDAGFTWITGTSFPANQCLRGDILLNEASHTQMYIGNNQDVNCGSTLTGAIVETHLNSYPWDGLLRYEG